MQLCGLNPTFVSKTTQYESGLACRESPFSSARAVKCGQADLRAAKSWRAPFGNT
jgi:hypothetical protein